MLDVGYRNIYPWNMVGRRTFVFGGEYGWGGLLLGCALTRAWGREGYSCYAVGGCSAR
jgi:hypothetical protein